MGISECCGNIWNKLILTLTILVSLATWSGDLAATIHYFSQRSEYEVRGEAIQAGRDDRNSNFNKNSKWFTELETEYLEIDKEARQNEYCDIVLMQEGPTAPPSDIDIKWLVVAGFGCAFLSWVGDCYNLWSTTNKFSKLMPWAEVYKRCMTVMWAFGERGMMVFFSVAPMITVLYYVCKEFSMGDGIRCQEMFYECGTSGECTMADLRAPLAEDASHLAIAMQWKWVFQALLLSFVNLAFTFAVMLQQYFTLGIWWIVVLATRPFVVVAFALSPVLLCIAYESGAELMVETTEGIAFLCLFLFSTSCCFCTICFRCYSYESNDQKYYRGEGADELPRIRWTRSDWQSQVGGRRVAPSLPFVPESNSVPYTLDSNEYIRDIRELNMATKSNPYTATNGAMGRNISNSSSYGIELSRPQPDPAFIRAQQRKKRAPEQHHQRKGPVPEQHYIAGFDVESAM